MRACVHGPLTVNCMKLKQVNKPRKEPDKVTQIDSQRFPVSLLGIFLSEAATGSQLRYDTKAT